MFGFRNTAQSRAPQAHGDLAVITPSYAGDFTLFERLHESIVRLSPDVIHHVIVPQRDLPLFNQLASTRCIIWSEKELLPPGMVSTATLGRLVGRVRGWPAGARIAAINVRRPFTPIRGWILQQVLKITLAGRLESQAVIVVDSDVVVVRPLSVDTFVRDGSVRFYRRADGTHEDLKRHVLWHNVSRKMLGVPAASPPLPDYVSSFMVWDPAIVRAIESRVVEHTGRPWASVIAAQRHFSEWTLYGTYVDEIAPASARSFVADTTLCLSYWLHSPLDSEGAVEFARQLNAEDVAVLVQSKSGTPDRVRDEMLREFSRIVASSD
jgi:hypothetical protein